MAIMNNEWVKIRKAALGDLEDVQTCGRDAYSKYIDRVAVG
jgi:hypothetical protein